MESIVEIIDFLKGSKELIQVIIYRETKNGRKLKSL
jgi:hypothetical protein